MSYKSKFTGQQIDQGIDKANSAYQKPETGIPETDMSTEVQASLGKAETALQDFTETDPTVPSWAKQPSKPTYTAQEVGALPSDTPLFSGDYNDLRNKPTIPTVPENVSAFNNDAGYLTEHQDISGKEDKSNKVTSLSVQSTDTQYPSAKAVFDELESKQDTINDLSTIRSGASAGATAYQKPQTGIPESDLSQGVKDKLNEKEVFWATYGQTTAAEIDAAVAAGKVVCSIYSNQHCTLVHITNDYYSFISVNRSNAILRLDLNRNTSAWSVGSFPIEITSRKVNSWQSTPDNTHYPSEKLVKDSLDVKADLSLMAKWGVVSQTQTWTQASDGGYDYTMSNLVYGWIPQANIDLYESAGAVFNETSGYFELNGLEDISYEEMKVIYAQSQSTPFASYSIGGWTPYFYDYRRFLTARTTTSNILSKDYYFPSFVWNQCVETIGFFKHGFSKASRTARLYGGVISFYSCNRLKTIYDVFDWNNASGTNIFYGCTSLETLNLTNIKANVSLSESARLSVESILYMINNEASTSAITITLHPTAYARAIADSDVQAALQAHTNVSLASAT